MKSSLLAIAIITILTIFLGDQPAHAYLDPGTGSYSAQVLLAGLLVGAYSLRAGIRQVFERIARCVKPR